jgi:hypothetical protein
VPIGTQIVSKVVSNLFPIGFQNGAKTFTHTNLL